LAFQRVLVNIAWNQWRVAPSTGGVRRAVRAQNRLAPLNPRLANEPKKH
jgi:hypothetical protein